MLNKLKDHVYDLVLYLATKGARKKPDVKKVLIVRLDEIGDYMLWRPLLPDLIAAVNSANTEIHFCGNKSWKSLFDLLDKQHIAHHYWMNKGLFKSNISYRYRFLRQVYKEGYDTVINPIFSRDKRYDDSVVMAAKATHRIGMKANQEVVRSYETGYDKNLYTQLFDHPAKPLFEFTRNRLFTGFVLGNEPQTTDTRVPISELPALAIPLPEKYFVVFPGSRSAARIWPTNSFVEAADFLFKHFGWTAIICGGPGDTSYAAAFATQYTYPQLNLTGKTTLPELLTVLSKATCLISVDTGSIHLAAAVGCTVFGVFNGSQYGRFAPYPKDVASNVYAVYPDEVEDDIKKNGAGKYEFVVTIGYDTVRPGKVIEAMRTHYNS